MTKNYEELLTICQLLKDYNTKTIQQKASEVCYPPKLTPQFTVKMIFKFTIYQESLMHNTELQ
jgi:hypothetical protein